MTLLVDPLLNCEGMNPNYPYKRSCHLFSDVVGDAGIAELHAMAAKIGLKRAWAQLPPRHLPPHYDLVTSKRILALNAGAQETHFRRVGEMALAWREHLGMPSLLNHLHRKEVRTDPTQSSEP